MRAAKAPQPHATPAKAAYGYGNVVPNKVVAAATVTIWPLKNVVQIHILITSVDLIKLAVAAIARRHATVSH
jgi:hypothetical protein